MFRWTTKKAITSASSLNQIIGLGTHFSNTEKQQKKQPASDHRVFIAVAQEVAQISNCLLLKTYKPNV